MTSLYMRMCAVAFCVPASLLINAQVAYDFPTAVPPLGIYAVERYGCFTSPTVDPAPPWDLSTVDFEAPQPMTWEWAPIADALFPAAYPGATHVLKDVTDGNEQIMLLAPDGLRQVGFASNVPGQMDDSLVLRVFPSVLGTTYTDTYQPIGDPGHSTAHFTPHAVGTLTTPFGTWPDVVLLETELTNFFGNTIEHSYKWYAQDNLLIPLAEYYLTSHVLFVDASSSTGVPVSTTASLLAWPVPTNSTVTLAVREGVLRAELTELSGKNGQVPFETEGTSCTVDLSAQVPGVYSLRLLTSRGWLRAMVVKE